MPVFRVRMTKGQRATIFDLAKTRAAGRRMVAEINKNLAQEGVTRVKHRLDSVLQNPTGYYKSRIAMRGTNEVWDSNVIYGGWLEGVSSRNKISRFKGYHTFRRVRQELNRDSERLAQPYVTKYVRELRGR